MENDDTNMATMLLTHWKECDKDRWDLVEGEMSVESITFKTNVNTRDLKGWNCACIAVFHKSLKVLELLCINGANLSMRSMYNRNAYDLAKDELDAAENVVTDKSDIRAVIEEFDQNSPKKNTLYGTSSDGGDGGDSGGKKKKGKGKGKGKDKDKSGGDNEDDGVLIVDPGSYEGLNSDGSPVVMQLEMNKTNEIKAKGGTSAETGKGKKAAGTATIIKKSGKKK